MTHFLANYKKLIARVDALCIGISESLGDQITCSEGCSSCCTSITIFPVEAAAMRDMLNHLPEQQADVIKQHIIQNADNERCPLLHNHRCLLYEARPIICRTHGLPIIYTTDDRQQSDCCPLNLSETEVISGANSVDLNKLNTLLVAINSIYLSETDSQETDLRLSIATALTRI